MGKLYSLISALLLAIGVTHAASPDSYEWWFDHDVSTAQSGTLSGDRLDLEIDTSNLPKGIHYFNLRMAEGDSVYGPVYRKCFHSLGQDTGAISYEYWFDSDYASKTAGSLNHGSNLLDLDISSLPEGSHFFNLRLGYGDGTWGSVYRKMVLTLAADVNATAYEYWLDDDYDAKTNGRLSSGNNSYDIDLNGLRKGLHRFCYRIMTAEGIWGAPFTKYFYCASNEARFSEYEYWLDNDFANRKRGTATSNEVSFDVDLSDFDKSGGAHYFHLRTRDGDGDWSPIYRKLLVFTDGDIKQPVIGYRHYLNGTDLGYVEVERQLTGNHMFDVNIPDSLLPAMKGIAPSFDGDKIYVECSDSMTYIMQMRTELGWDVPKRWNVEVTNEFSTTAVEMEINSKQSFHALKSGTFAAVKFTSTGAPLYFRADVPVALDLYRNGEKVSEFPGEEIAGMASAELEAGEYFGILHDVADTEADSFTFHLMDTENTVPTPEISFADGLVTITCGRSDTEIRYTLDGTDPDRESTLYTGPFVLDHNAEVKAIAYVPDSDIAPSEVASCILVFTVEPPTGSFDVTTRLLTLECSTPGARIIYSWNEVDPDGDTIDGYSYVAPIPITRNCTVYAWSIIGSHLISEIVRFDITGLEDTDMQCAPVEIRYDGRYVSMTTVEAGATILYAVDGDPTEGGMAYEGEFDLEGLGTVRAVAVRDGMRDSDMTELTADRYADELHAETASEGVLASAFGWNPELPYAVEEYRIEGHLGADDYALLRSMQRLRELDLSGVREARMPDGALRGTRLITVSLPEDLAEYGDSILSGTGQLCSVIWNSTAAAPAPRLTDGLANPNALLYVPASVNLPYRAGLNVVRGDRATDVTLTYGHPYHAARAFRADYVSLSHEFTQSTRIGGCRGWETLTLPFAPTSIRHREKGAAVPFPLWDGGIDGPKPFWLCTATPTGWEQASSIEACVPYIISMPNDPEYTDAYNLGGQVTFSAFGVDLGPDTNAPYADTWINGTTLEGTFLPVEEEGLLSLNVSVPEGGEHEPGGAFTADAVTPPFGAYVRGAGPRKAIPLFGEGSGLDLPAAVDPNLVVETPAPGQLRLTSGRERNVDVTTATGAVLRTLRLRPGESVTLEGLTRDLYIVAGRKVFVR